jgi:hypothetical protein
VDASTAVELERLALVRQTVSFFMKLNVRAAVSFHERPVVRREGEVSTDSVDITASGHVVSFRDANNLPYGGVGPHGHRFSCCR